MILKTLLRTILISYAVGIFLNTLKNNFTIVKIVPKVGDVFKKIISEEGKVYNNCTIIPSASKILVNTLFGDDLDMITFKDGSGKRRVIVLNDDVEFIT